MTIASKFLKVTALASAFLMSGCDFEKMAQEEQREQAEKEMVIKSTHIADVSYFNNLEDGIHKIRIPASASLDGEDKVKILLKDDFGGRAYLYDLGEFPDEAKNTSTDITVESLKLGDFVDYSAGSRGLKNLRVSCDVFPDNQARDFLILTNYQGLRGYPVVLESQIVSDEGSDLGMALE